MRCARVQERLLLYLAGELTPKENDRLRDHLARCAACAALAEDLTATQARVASGLKLEVEPPATLDARVMGAIRALPVPRPARSGFSLNWRPQPRFAFGTGLAGLLVLAFALGNHYATKPALELASLGAAHSQRIAASSPPQMQGSDAQQLTRAMTSLVPFRVRAVDLKSEGAVLVGGSQTTVDHTTVAALDYNWEGHPISLYEMDGAKSIPLPLRHLGREPDSYFVHKAGNMTYVAWHSGKTDCVMVAQAVPMHQLFHLACRACERQE